MTAMSGPHHDARAVSTKDPTGWLQAGPAGAAVLAEQLQTAVVEMSKWMREFGEFTPHPSLAVGEEAVVRCTAELRGIGCAITIPSSIPATSARC
jgi:hypothetical protein